MHWSQLLKRLSCWDQKGFRRQLWWTRHKSCSLKRHSGHPRTRLGSAKAQQLLLLVASAWRKQNLRKRPVPSSHTLLRSSQSDQYVYMSVCIECQSTDISVYVSDGSRMFRICSTIVMRRVCWHKTSTHFKVETEECTWYSNAGEEPNTEVVFCVVYGLEFEPKSIDFVEINDTVLYVCPMHVCMLFDWCVVVVPRKESTRGEVAGQRSSACMTQRRCNVCI